MILVSCCSCLCPINWSQVLNREWRCSWSSVDRRAPTTSEWLTSLLPGKVQLILEIWQLLNHDDVMIWKHLLHFWTFLRGNTLITGGFPHKGPVIQSFDESITPTKLLNKHAELSSYPGYFWEPHWPSMGFLEISRYAKKVIWRHHELYVLSIMYITDSIHNRVTASYLGELWFPGDPSWGVNGIAWERLIGSNTNCTEYPHIQLIDLWGIWLWFKIVHSQMHFSEWYLKYFQWISFQV